MSNMFERLAAKQQAAGIVKRNDLHMDDFVISGSTAANCVFSYDNTQGRPTHSEVLEWLGDRLGADYGTVLQARLETTRTIPEHSCFTMVLERIVPRAPLSAAAGMTMLNASASKYLDRDQCVWQVVEGQDGAGKSMIRAGGDDMAKIMEVRRSALEDVARAGRGAVMFAYLIAEGYASAQIGDTVEIFANGQQWRGELKSSSGGSVVVSCGQDGTFTVDETAILGVVTKGAKGAQNQSDIQRRMANMLYPGNPEMAALLSPNSRLPLGDPLKREIKPMQSVNASADDSKKKSNESGTVSAPRFRARVR